MNNEEKIAHLGFIQGITNRMGNNSFLIKGWSVTLTAAIFALAAEKSNTNFAYLTLFPLFFFWGLDAYYLHQERLYRKLYEKAANNALNLQAFSMNAHIYKEEVACLCRVFFSRTLIGFYGPMTSLILAVLWKFTSIMATR